MPVCTFCSHGFSNGTRCPVCGTEIRPRREEITPTQRSNQPSAGEYPEVLERPVPIGVMPNVDVAHQALVGTVAQTQGPHTMPAAYNWWKAGCLTLLLLGLGPLMLCLAVIGLSFRIALAILGLGGGRGGRSWLDEILIFHVIGSLVRRDEPVPVYVHVVETTNGLAAARQNGEFVDGRIFPGHRVRLNGRLRQGTLIIESGSYNETLGSALNFRPPRWRASFVLMLVAVAAEWYFILNLVEVIPK